MKNSSNKVQSQQHLTKDQLPKFAEKLVQTFSNRQIVLLEGPLAAGKTELVRHLVKALGGQPVSSPTFSLIQDYSTQQELSIYHIDLYRLGSSEELEGTGFWDLFDVDQGIIFIEWPQRVELDQLPIDWQKVHLVIEKSSENDRIYQVLNS